ncbi:hypothetical protein ZOSMA_4G01270 [Zostera marina]|uniref:Uncharacterized protein n=1 Tax=Zostera marina TaxID=29655 RepID=A0A0K9NYQ2_ZOSMR|nr:hypothetical protein ZOSMA_4G01270 [Zostera marina]
MSAKMIASFSPCIYKTASSFFSSFFLSFVACPEAALPDCRLTNSLDKQNSQHNTADQ